MLIDPEVASKSVPAVADTHAKRLTWWLGLTPVWRSAFQTAILQHSAHPTAEELEYLWQIPAIRFTGPRAPYPNLPFELTDCSGLQGMSNLEIVVLTHHQLGSVTELATLPKLRSLFVNNNSIRSLTGIESLKKLEQLYAQFNQIDSLVPVRELTGLREIYINFNPIKTLDGITAKHARNLKGFFCLPNDDLPDREVMRVEQRLGIRCRAA